MPRQRERLRPAFGAATQAQPSRHPACSFRSPASLSQLLNESGAPKLAEVLETALQPAAPACVKRYRIEESWTKNASDQVRHLDGRCQFSHRSAHISSAHNPGKQGGAAIATGAFSMTTDLFQSYKDHNRNTEDRFRIIDNVCKW